MENNEKQAKNSAVSLTFQEAAELVDELREEIRSASGDAPVLKIDTPEKRAILLDSLTFMANEIANEAELRMAGLNQ